MINTDKSFRRKRCKINLHFQVGSTGIFFVFSKKDERNEKSCKQNEYYNLFKEKRN